MCCKLIIVGGPVLYPMFEVAIIFIIVEQKESNTNECIQPWFGVGSAMYFYTVKDIFVSISSWRCNVFCWLLLLVPDKRKNVPWQFATGTLAKLFEPTDYGSS